jgi:hypothetical protein
MRRLSFEKFFQSAAKFRDADIFTEPQVKEIGGQDYPGYKEESYRKP